MRDIRRMSRHRPARSKGQFRLFLGALFVVGLMLLFRYYAKEFQQEDDVKILTKRDYVPDPKEGTVYHKPYFSLSYVEEYEIPEWVAYRLTVGMLNKKKFPRDQDFNPDAGVKEGSAHYHDYKGSGYRRGHLVPSADMAWDKAAMDATFLLSNIAPMRQKFNDGVWQELEHNVRDWARRYRDIIVVAGPVLTASIDTIGKNDVVVPKYFYKAIFTVEDTIPHVIGFLFDQTFDTADRLDKFIVPIDSIEKITGLDLFANMYGDWDAEIELEKSGEREQGEWEFNERWFAQRIENTGH